MTSGVGDTIDYFVSIDAAEPRLGTRQYDEQLVRMRGAHSLFDAFTLALPAAEGGAGAACSCDPAAAGLAAGTTARFWLQSALPRAAFGARVPPAGCARGAVYLCPQTLYKLHPSFDGVLVGLLARDRCGLLVLVEGSAAAWTEAVVRSRAGARGRGAHGARRCDGSRRRRATRRSCPASCSCHRRTTARSSLS